MNFPKKDLLIVLTWIGLFMSLVILTPILFTFFKPMLFAFLIAFILSPFIRFLENKLKIKKKVGLLFFSIILILSCTLILYLLLHSLVSELYSLINDIPAIYKDIEMFIHNCKVDLMELDNKLTFIDLNLENNVDFKFKLPSSEDILNALLTSVTTVFNSVKNFVNSVIHFIFIILFSISFTLNWNNIQNKINNLLQQSNISNALTEIKNVLTGYVLAQIKLLGITFIVVFIGFMIVDTKYVLLLSLLTSVLDMLPFFGTGTVLTPIGIIAFFNGDYKLVIACIGIYVITFLIRRTLEPKLVGDSVGISVFTSTLFMFIGYQLIGILGLIVGVPIGVLCTYLYKEKVFDSFILSIKNLFLYIKQNLQ